MKFTRKQTITILLVAALVFGFTLFQASWLAPVPEGDPKLVADHAAEPVRDTAGCIASANSGFGGVSVAPDIAALQAAAGQQADAIRVTTAMVDDKLVLARQFESECPADKARAPVSIADVSNGLTRPELFWQVRNEAEARQLVANLPMPQIDTVDRNLVIGDEAAVKFVQSLRPGTKRFLS